MLVTNVLLILSILTLLTQAAPLPNAVITKQQIIEFQRNVERLNQGVDKAKKEYEKICNCVNYLMGLGISQFITETTARKAVEKSQSGLLPFVTLLFDMTQEEKDLTLKHLLVEVGTELNDTYDTTVRMIGKVGQSQSKNIITLTSLNVDTSHFLNGKGMSNKTLQDQVRNYNVLEELDDQIFNIRYAFGKLTNGVNVLTTVQKKRQKN